MVSAQSVEQQLKKIDFKHRSWGKTEISELPAILLEDEEIYECVNGVYEGGFALLVATNIRVLLIDKKPLKYLTVEDLRFDMINELDYSHRLFGAHINISAGNKNLKFTSYNQPRLRKLMSHVQHCIAELKKKQNEHQEDQKQHLEQINQQLQTYLMAQHNQLMQAQQQGAAVPQAAPEPPRPAPELSDYLFAQSLLHQYQQQTGAELPVQLQPLPVLPTAPIALPVATSKTSPDGNAANGQLASLYAEGYQEVFGKTTTDTPTVQAPAPAVPAAQAAIAQSALEINPLRIAYSKLPMALRNRKFGRPSFHAHSQAPVKPQTIAP